MKDLTIDIPISKIYLLKKLLIEQRGLVKKSELLKRYTLRQNAAMLEKILLRGIDDRLISVKNRNILLLEMKKDN